MFSHSQTIKSCQEYRVIAGSEATENSAFLVSSDEQRDKAYICHGGCVYVRANGSYQYSYGPGGVLGLKRNLYTLLCAFFVSIGGLEFGYDQGVVSSTHNLIG